MNLLMLINHDDLFFQFQSFENGKKIPLDIKLAIAKLNISQEKANISHIQFDTKSISSNVSLESHRKIQSYEEVKYGIGSKIKKYVSAIRSYKKSLKISDDTRHFLQEREQV